MYCLIPTVFLYLTDLIGFFPSRENLLLTEPDLRMAVCLGQKDYAITHDPINKNVSQNLAKKFTSLKTHKTPESNLDFISNPDLKPQVT